MVSYVCGTWRIMCGTWRMPAALTELTLFLRLSKIAFHTLNRAAPWPLPWLQDAVLCCTERATIHQRVLVTATRARAVRCGQQQQQRAGQALPECGHPQPLECWGCPISVRSGGLNPAIVYRRSCSVDCSDLPRMLSALMHVQRYK